MTLGSDPKRRSQKRCASNATLGPPGRSSCCVYVRPCRGSAPQRGKKSAVACVKRICSGSSPALELATPNCHAEGYSRNWVCFLQKLNRAGEPPPPDPCGLTFMKKTNRSDWG